MAKVSTTPGLGGQTTDDDVASTATEVDEAFDPTTLRDVVVGTHEEHDQLVAKYRTDPRLQDAPEMALLRGINADKKKRGLQGFRDGLEDAKKGSAIRAHRDEALQRLADETAADVVARRETGASSPVNDREAPTVVAHRIVAPSPLRRLLIIAALVVVGGVIVFALVGHFAPRGEAKDPAPPSPHPSVSATATGAPSQEAAAPSATISAAPQPPPTPTPSSTSSAAPTARPKAAPSAPEPTKRPSVPAPSATVFDPMQGT